MIRVLKIFLSACVTLFFVSLFTFVLMKLVPGGPFDSEKALPPEVLALLNKKFRLDLPWHLQYLYYLRDVFINFDFGPSTRYIGRSVNEIIKEGLPVSLELGFYSLSISVVLGVVLGVLAAAFRGTWLDFSAMFGAVLGVSLPSFLVAGLAILVFSQYLQVLPAALWDSPAHKVLPSIVLGLRPAALIARMTRSSVLEVLYLDFVRTAKAKGLSFQKVLFIHVLRNALIPVLTIMGPLSAAILTGSFVIEYVFSVPGLGTHFIQAVTNRDDSLVMGVTLLYGTFLVGINLFVDLLYGVVDPRIRNA